MLIVCYGILNLSAPKPPTLLCSDLKEAEEKMRKQHEVELRQLREEQENRLGAMDDVRRKKESDFQDMRKKYEEEKVRIEKTAADSERRLQEKILLLVEELRRIRERFESQEMELKTKLSKSGFFFR